MFQLLLSVVVLGATIYAVIDVLTSDQSQVRYLDRIIWVILIVLVPIVGVVVWFAIGKDRGSSGEVIGRGGPAERTESSSFDRPPRLAAAEMSDEEIDAAVEREIEFHERQARIRRLEAEVKAKRDEQPGG